MCERCGRHGITMHHRLKRSQAGKWEPDNIAALCGDGVRGCHGWTEANPSEAEAQGWHVRPWNNPAEIPVFYRNSFWAILNPDGTIEEVQWQPA